MQLYFSCFHIHSLCTSEIELFPGLETLFSCFCVIAHACVCLLCCCCLDASASLIPQLNFISVAISFLQLFQVPVLLFLWAPLLLICILTIVIFCLVILTLAYLSYCHHFYKCIQPKPFLKCSNLGMWGLSAIIRAHLKVLLWFLKMLTR